MQTKSGFVSLTGRPNVGKSTLMNQLLGEKVAITSRKPQTTRNRIQGVYTEDDTQIVFIDTPGIHQAAHKLGEYMNEAANRTIGDVDFVCLLVEAVLIVLLIRRRHKSSSERQAGQKKPRQGRS